MRDAARAAPPGLRRTGETCLWLVVIAGAALAALWAAAQLRLVVLPVVLAVILATLLAPPTGWLRRRGWPDAAAAAATLTLALVALAAVAALVVPRAAAELDELDIGITGGVDEVERWLVEGPLDLSRDQVDGAISRLEDELRDNAGALGRGAVSGAIVLAEVVTGLVLAIVVLFFVLKDGRRIWAWLAGLAPAARRARVDEAGRRAWEALGGFLRGQSIVALFDAVFIGLALLVIGVPLVLPLALLTFFGAYVPIIGATVAGAAAALVALFAEGPAAALAVLAAIIVVQQVEGNLLEPYVVGRSVDVHPVAILLGITAGGVLAGIVGAMVAAPAVAVGGALLRSAREPAGDP